MSAAPDRPQASARGAGTLMDASPAHKADPAGHDPDADLTRAVEQKLLDMAYGRVRQSVALTAIVFVVFVWLFRNHFPTNLKIVWVCGMVLIAMLRLLLSRAYDRADGAAREHPRWRTLFFVAAVAAGLGWAFGPVMLMPAAGQVESMLLVLTALAVSAVSVSALGGQVLAMLSFQACLLVPSLLALAATGGEVEQQAAAVMFAGMVSLMIVGRASSAATRALVETELRLSRSVAETSAARERAEIASQAKTRFLANMSHELRSPLNAVIGAAQLLRTEERDVQRQAQLVDAIQSSGTNLLGLIDNILDLSRIESGKLRVVPLEFHLIDCIDTALATAGLAARAKGLRLACIVEPRLPPWRLGDAGALRQVLLNLLGNAVKFTQQGDIVVHVQHDGSEDGDGVRIVVSDTGTGIGPEALAHVFEPFRQADEGTMRRFGGSGLGLAIVRQLTDAMGGHIAVSSVPGQGSEFTLVLPLPRTVQQEPPASTHARRVAFVEPHGASAQALQALLTRMGCVAVQCIDAQALQAWCRSTQSTPGGGWLLLCNDDPRIRSLLPIALRYVPPDRILGMSGAQTPDAALPDGVPAIASRVLKPVLRAALTSCLVQAERAAPTERRVAEQPGATTTGAGSEPGAGLRILVVEDDAVNRTIVNRMLQHAGYRVSLAADGQSALATLREQRFDLVLMDWQMPDMDGLEVTRRMRDGTAGDAARQVPVVALTANAFAEDRQACLGAGMNDFLTKPVLASTLTATIVRWTRHDAARDAAAPNRP